MKCGSKCVNNNNNNNNNIKSKLKSINELNNSCQINGHTYNF